MRANIGLGEPDWWDNAACRGQETIFYQTVTDEKIKEAVEKAKAFCADCVALSDCFFDALKNDSYGVRGGLTYSERQAIRESIPDLTRPILTHAPVSNPRPLSVSRTPQVLLDSEDIPKLGTLFDVFDLPELHVPFGTQVRLDPSVLVL